MGKENIIRLADYQNAGTAETPRDDMLYALTALSEDLGSETLFALLLPQFIADLESRLRRIDRAIAAGDCETICHHAGLLKRSAANMQLPYFSEMLERLETCAGQMQLPDAAFGQHFARAAEFVLSEMIARLSV